MSVGQRRAYGIGYSISAGIVINRNNYWDSGISLKVGIGFGFEVAAETPLNPIITNFVDLSSSAVDFSNPTSTVDIEGTSINIYALAGIGISHNMQNNKITGIETGGVGGGVYYEETKVITAGKIIEGISNSSIFVMNSILKRSGMDKFIKFKYLELDGR